MIFDDGPPVLELTTVADDHVDVGRAVTREVRPSGFGEVVPALDTPDLGGETAE